MIDPLVTVVITTFRRAKFLPEAIESVLRQTYGNIELIVIDDNGEGTPDQLATAIAVGRMNDSRIRYRALKQNAGASAARNAGTMLANGFYVAFLDDDDIILPEKIAKQVQYMKSRDESCGGCGTWLKRIYPNGAEFAFKPPDGTDVFLAAIKRVQTYQTSTFLFKRQALLDIGMFDTAFRGLEDPELVIRLSLRYHYGMVEEILTLVRSRDEKTVAESEEHWTLKLLGKFEKEIGDLPSRDRKEIYFLNYFNLSKKFLQSRKLKKAVHYFMRCGNPFKYAYRFVADTVAYIIRKRAIRRDAARMQDSES